MNKILVLGSDFGSIDVVRQAKSMGWYVIVADYLDKHASHAKQIADEDWKISTAEIDILEEKCIANDIQAVFCGAHDFNIGKVRLLCKRLCLPTYCKDDTTWDIANNKRLFKNLCKKVNAPIAEDYIINDDISQEQLMRIKYPVVVKPVDLCANRGMSYCDNERELIDGVKLAKSMSTNPEVIVERKLEGPEFAVNYLICNGVAQLLYFSSEHSEPGYPKNLYSLIITTSCHLKKWLEEVNDKVIAVFKEAGCKEGIAWVECILDKDNHFYLLEMGHRFGGEMTYIPYEKISGFNTVKWMTEIAMGVNHEIKDMPVALSSFMEGVAASYHLFTCMSGKISRIHGLEEVKNVDGVDVDFIRQEGDIISKGSAIGIIRIYGKTPEDLCKLIAFINNHLKVTGEDGDNMIIYFTDYEAVISEYQKGITEWGII